MPYDHTPIWSLQSPRHLYTNAKTPTPILRQSSQEDIIKMLCILLIHLYYSHWLLQSWKMPEKYSIRWLSKFAETTSKRNENLIWRCHTACKNVDKQPAKLTQYDLNKYQCEYILPLFGADGYSSNVLYMSFFKLTFTVMSFCNRLDIVNGQNGVFSKSNIASSGLSPNRPCKNKHFCLAFSLKIFITLKSEKKSAVGKSSSVTSTFLSEQFSSSLECILAYYGTATILIVEVKMRYSIKLENRAHLKSNNAGNPTWYDAKK